MLSESERIKRAIERVADAEIEKKTAPCFRTYKAIVTEAPNGATCKVRLCGDDTELELPYASKLASIPVGKYVWVGAFYNVDNSMSNAIVWDTLKFDIEGGGGGNDGLSIYYIEGANSIGAVTTSPYYSARWKGTDARITALTTGLTIIYKTDVAGHSTYNVVLDINGLGEHPVVRNADTGVGAAYPIGTSVILTYDAEISASVYQNSASAAAVQGVWKVADYASTATYQLRKNSGAIAVKSNAGSLYRYMLCMTDINGELIPFNNVSNARTTYTKVMNSQAFDPFGFIFWYYTTTTVTAGSNAAASALYRQIAYDVRYSLNINSSGTAGTTALTTNKPVYLKALFDPDTHLATFTQVTTSTSYLERSSITQALPTTNPNTGRTDNKFYIYIYLGQAYSKYQMELSVVHPVYAWDGVNNTMFNFYGIMPTTVVINGTTIKPDANGQIDLTSAINALISSQSPSYTQTTTLFSGSASVESI